MRTNICEPVPMPRSLNPTLAWIATRKVVLQNPMPIPETNAAAAAHRQSLSDSSSASMIAAVSRQAPPIPAVSR